MSITGNIANVQTSYTLTGKTLTSDSALAKPFYKPGGATPDRALIGEHLKRELKTELHDKQQQSLIKALSKLDDWLTERKQHMDTLAGQLSHTYAIALENHINAGYPYDEAVAKATREANVLYQLKLEELDVLLPGANVLLTGAFKDRQYQGEQGALFNGGDAIDFKAKYFKRQAKKMQEMLKKKFNNNYKTI